MSGSDLIHIGTSGWHYDHWKGPFYPEEISQEKFLEFYSGRFSTAEINNTFYRMPEKEMLAHWHETVPDDFVFSVKASRYITHMKKLKETQDSLKRFLERIETLEKKLGPILFQLPPKWHINTDRLRDFMKTLPDNFRFVFEFRDQTWLENEVYKLLGEKNAGFCIYDFEGRQSPREVTSDLLYIRLHGPDGAYRGSYEQSTLSEWAESIKGWAGQNKNVYCYFDNDEAGYAAQNALTLQSMLKG